MKKTLLLAVFLVLCTAQTGWSATAQRDMVSDFDLLHEGVSVLNPGGKVLELRPNETVVLTVKKLSTQTIWVSGDETGRYDGLVVGMNQAHENQTVGGTMVNLYYSPSLDTLQVSSTGVVNGLMNVQFEGNVVGPYGTPNPGPFYSPLKNVRLKTVGSPTLNYLFVPKLMALVDSNGNELSGLFTMKGGETRRLLAVAKDFGNDGNVENDYDVYSVNGLVMDPLVDVADDFVVGRASSVPALTGATPESPPNSRIIANVEITAVEEGGDSGSDYNPRFTSFFYQITFGGTTGAGEDLAGKLDNGGVIKTQPVSLKVVADGDESSGGGSCSASGWGAFLLFPGLFFLKKKNRS